MGLIRGFDLFMAMGQYLTDNPQHMLLSLARGDVLLDTRMEKR
jgi:hypothetical protein